MSASNTMQKLIKGDIDESQYLDKVNERQLHSDYSYLHKSGDINLFSDEFDKKILNNTSLDKIGDILPQAIESNLYNFQNVINEVVKRYNEAIDIVEKFIKSSPTKKNQIEDINRILNNDGEISFKWWEVDEELAFGSNKLAAIIAGLQDGVEISGKKVKRSKCLKDDALPTKYMDSHVYHSVNFLSNTNYKSRYKTRSHNNALVVSHEKIQRLPKEKRDKVIGVISNQNCSIEDMPNSIVKDYYDHAENKLIEKARKNPDIKERLKNIGVSSIEDKIIETSYENLIEVFSDRKSLKNRHVHHYNSDHSVNRIKTDMKNLTEDKLKEVWNKEFEYNGGSEKIYQDITDICTATVLEDITWDLSCLSVLDNEIKTDIVKNKTRKANSKHSVTSISWPSFDINKEVLDGLTALQLAKFINHINSRDKDKLDITDQNFYKQKLSRKIFKGDSRAKQAMDKVKDALRDDDDKSNSSSSNSKTKTKQGIMKEKAKKAHNQIKSWVEDFTSFGDLVEYIKEKNEDLMDEPAFTQLWDKVEHSNTMNNLRYKAKRTGKTNLKIIKELVNNAFDQFTIPEVDDE